MKYADHFTTKMWECPLEYGPFKGRFWYGIGGYKHPLFRAIAREIKAMYAVNQFNIQDYGLWLCGGILEDWVSFDVDMVLIGAPSEDAYKTLHKIKHLGFLYGVYIDINLQEDSQGIFINCGGIANAESIQVRAYEISNIYVQEGNKTEYPWIESDYQLFEKKLTYPFKKNLDKFRESGYIYNSPKLMTEIYKEL
jgi:hypothetical protein